MIRTVTFDTVIDNGIIVIPEKFGDFRVRKPIKVRVTMEAGEATTTAPSTPESVRGILAKYKNPALIEKETAAWEMAVMEKHADC